jgi:hypothetical protein
MGYYLKKDGLYKSNLHKERRVTGHAGKLIRINLSTGK